MSDSMPPLPPEQQTTHVQSALANGANKPPEKFSPEALNEFSSRTANYATNLERISRIVADQKNVDDVSAYHVRLAVEALGGGESKRNRRIAELGVLLIGSALGYAGNVAIAKDYTFANAIIFVVPFAIGLFLYGLTIGQD